MRLKTFKLYLDYQLWTEEVLWIFLVSSKIAISTYLESFTSRNNNCILLIFLGNNNKKDYTLDYQIIEYGIGLSVKANMNDLTCLSALNLDK